jgi:alpha-mannosidase
MLIHMIGNAHIDPVWLWPWQAGADEAIATMISAADRCDEYPGFVFTRGEAWVYQQAEKLHPELILRIKKLVERGQWHITGGQFLQPDLNLPTEAGLHQQILFGQRYFKDRFGVSPTTGYNVDSFGHTASFPDILAEHGYTSYVFRRPEQHQVALPANTFVWRGVGGGEVTAFRINPGYVANFADLTGQVQIAIESADPALGHTMCFYGVGNHGGGPSKAMIEWIIANRHSFDGHELIFSTPQAFMDSIESERERLPQVSTELQHTFPGCYSVMQDIKSAQRRGEHLLDQATRAANAFAANEKEREAYVERIECAWPDLLFTAFHDILPGTSIPSAWPSVRAMQGRARIDAEEVLHEVMRRWSYRTLPRVNEQQIVVVNTDDGPFTGYVEAEPYLDFDDWGRRWLSDDAGEPVTFQEIQPESNQMIPRILFPAHIDGRAGRQFQVRNDPAPSEMPVRSELLASPEHLSNGEVAVSLGAGGIAQIAVSGKEVLDGGIGLHLRRDTTDTWTFHTDRWNEPVESVLGDAAWQLEESGPLRVRARLDARLGNSRIRWTVSLCRGERRVVIDLDVNFDERFTLLQVPCALRAVPSRWSDGIAGAHVDREPSPSEWSFLGWSRLRVGETDLGLVTNDCYSHSVDGNTWQLTLLRSPKMAIPTRACIGSGSSSTSARRCLRRIWREPPAATRSLLSSSIVTKE